MSALATVVVRAAGNDAGLAATLAALEALPWRASIDVVVGDEVDAAALSTVWVATLRAGEHLLPGWLAAIEGCAEADLVYGDSIAAGGAVPARRPRPAWSPLLWSRLRYFDSGAAVRRELLGGGRVAAADLVELAVARTAAVRHVEDVIVAEHPGPGPRRGPAPVRSAGLVSLVIPTRDRADLLRPCLESIRRTTAEPHEILVVDNDSREPETHRLLADFAVRVVPFPGEFHFSRMNDVAAAEARGDVLVFLNNDTVAEHGGWLAELAGLALEPGVGAVGAHLDYPDGRIQHAGILVHPGARVDHMLSKARPDAVDHPWALTLPHEVAAVTGACLAIRRELFFRMGGFDESLRVAFNDVDLCLRLRERGYRVTWTPGARITHHECATREPLPPLADEVLFRARWAGGGLDADPYLEPVRRALGDALALPAGEYRRADLDPA